MLQTISNLQKQANDLLENSDEGIWLLFTNLQMSNLSCFVKVVSAKATFYDEQKCIEASNSNIKI